MEKENKIKQLPFNMPDGYIEKLEASVHKRIFEDSEEKITLFDKLRPYFYMTASFVLVLGICYGATNMIPKGEEDALFALIDEGYLSASFIDDYYGEIELNFPDEILNDEVYEDIESNIRIEDIIETFE